MDQALEPWRPLPLGADAIRGISTRDTIENQLRELIEVRHPACKLGNDALSKLTREHLGGVPAREYGSWFFYPWLDLAVHVLPRSEFDEVRLSRNRDKITTSEQARLANLHVGIAGLSVGQSTAVTLAMEGVGGTFSLADFDELSLSNMNRLRAGVHDIGVNKAVMTARQMYEVNPYLNIQLFPDGVHDDNLDAFMCNGSALGLLIEECDDMYMKFRLREAARAFRIPVLMETSDRGMIDVERFDLEPDRPLFHGRVNGMRSSDLRVLTPEQKMGVAMTIVGADSVSARMAASAVEIGSSLKTWPQLASAVALGAGINVDTARRIALGEVHESGRYYVDLECLVGTPTQEIKTVAAMLEPPSNLSLPSRHTPEPAIREIVRCAAAAPSGGNAQPWRFQWNGRRLRFLIDRSRAGGMLDYKHRATHLAFGAAAENALLHAGALGWQATLRFPPDSINPGVVCDLDLSSTSPAVGTDPLHRYIHDRATNRRLGTRAPLSALECDALRAAAASRGAHLILIQDDASMHALAATLGRGDRLRFLNRSLHRELMSELRWTPEAAELSRDGIDLRTLEVSGMDLAALKLTANWRVMDMIGRIGGGANLQKFALQAAKGSSAFGLLHTDSPDDVAWFEGGRAMQRVWLTATHLGLGFQPLAALSYLFMRAQDGGEGLSREETDTLMVLRAQYRQVLGLKDNARELLLFRVAKVAPPSTRALRRSWETLLDVEIKES